MVKFKRNKREDGRFAAYRGRDSDDRIIEIFLNGAGIGTIIQFYEHPFASALGAVKSTTKFTEEGTELPCGRVVVGPDETKKVVKIFKPKVKTQ